MYEYDPAKILSSWQKRQANNSWFKDKRGFACFVVSNGVVGDACKVRDSIFHGLSTYRWVNSAGFHLNNMNNGIRAPREGFIDWIGSYKFMICSENSLAPGYFTEKLSQPYRAGTIPIYYSDSNNLKWWNPESMIFHTSVEDTIRRVREIDSDPAKYMEMVSACPFRGEQIPELLKWSRIYKELDTIVEQLRY